MSIHLRPALIVSITFLFISFLSVFSVASVISVSRLHALKEPDALSRSHEQRRMHFLHSAPSLVVIHPRAIFSCTSSCTRTRRFEKRSDSFFRNPSFSV